MQSSYAGNPVMEWTMPGLDGIPRSRAKLMQRRVFLEALFLLRIEMQRLGRTPLSLDGLAIPPDPMTGRPFRYERTREGLELRASESEDDLEWEEDTLFKLRH